jgi:ABC-2 type transport system ATP-binding protein
VAARGGNLSGEVSEESMDAAIRVEEVRRTYRVRKRGEGFWQGLRAYLSVSSEQVEAIRDVSFVIRRGESVGLIGENGAGKSTVIKLLTGVLLPTSGRVRTLGLDPWEARRDVAMNIGVVFGQRPQLLWDLPPKESFRLLKLMYDIPNDTYAYVYREAVERLELGRLLTRPVRFLSLGERMRCDLAAALLHAPAIAFLDEPTIGLDVLVKERVREFLGVLRERFGMTIVLTTHDLKDIAAVCERLIVLDKGSSLYDGSLEGFERQFAETRTVLVDVERRPDEAASRTLFERLSALEVTSEWMGPRRVRLTCRRPDSVPSVMSLLLAHLSIRDLSLQGADIDALVARLYRRDKNP